jgi:large subunit ribosomal protein L18
MINHNLTAQANRKLRIRRSLLVRSTRARLTVNRSNQHISAQIIGQDGKVVCAFSSVALKDSKSNKTEVATKVGTKLAELAKEKNVTEVVFDRGSYRFHGRVKALAEAVRQSGINF